MVSKERNTTLDQSCVLFLDIPAFVCLVQLWLMLKEVERSETYWESITEGILLQEGMKRRWDYSLLLLIHLKQAASRCAGEYSLPYYNEKIYQHPCKVPGLFSEVGNEFGDVVIVTAPRVAETSSQHEFKGQGGQHTMTGTGANEVIKEERTKKLVAANGSCGSQD